MYPFRLCPYRIACAMLVVSPLWAASVRAQSAASEWSVYTSMRQMNQVLVDDSGEVWAATNGGALHFNRETQEYRRFTRLDGLAANKLLSVTQDERGDLWFGSDGQGLSRLDGETGFFAPPHREFQGLRINALKAVGNRLYVGTAQGVSVFLIDKREVKETYRDLGAMTRDAEVTGIAVLDGILFAGTEEGIAWAQLSQPNLQDPDSWNALRGAGVISDLLVAGDLVIGAGDFGTFVYSVSRDRFVNEMNFDNVPSVGLFEGSVVAVTEAGEFLSRDGSGTWNPLQAPVMAGVRDLSKSDGAMWMATDRGLAVLGADPPPPSREPAANRFYEMLLDNGNLWVASTPNDFQVSFGAYRLSESGWTVFDEDSGMPTDDLVTFATDASDRLWIGTWGEGVSIFFAGRWLRLDQENSPLIGIGSKGDFVVVSDIARDDAGNMWMVNVAGGLVVVDGFPAQQGYLFPQQWLGLPGDVYRVLLTPDGLKWVVSRTDGLAIVDDGGTPFDGSDDRVSHINSGVEERLSSDRIFDLLRAPDGTFWAATDNGLNAFTGRYSPESGSFEIDSWRVYTTSDDLLSNEINDVESDAAGNVWVATEAGLSQIGARGQVQFTFNRGNSGLIDDRVKSLLFDPERGEMWIGTFDGLNRLQLGLVTTQDPAPGLGVFPNPFDPGRNQQLTFSGLPLGSAVNIYRADGQLVRHLPGEPGKGSAAWSGLLEGGFVAASGIYFFVSEDEEGNRVRGKFALIDGASRP